MILLALAYLALVAFAAAVALRALAFARMPVHLRWELYPVPHDANAAHGGSVLEHPDWWLRKTAPNHAADRKVMVKEILLLDGVRAHDRALWLRSYPFHGGLYLLGAFIGLLFASALADRIGLTTLSSLLASAGAITELVGLLLLGAGAAGLMLRRLGEPALRAHSAPADFFNLACFVGVAVLGLAALALVDGSVAHLRAFARGLLTFTPVELPGLVAAQVVTGLALLVYIPLTHMSHFFTKWFTYHAVRWDDRSNRVGSRLEATIQRQLGTKVTWRAAHVGGGAGRTWVDVATAEVKK